MELELPGKLSEDNPLCIRAKAALQAEPCLCNKPGCYGDKEVNETGRGGGNVTVGKGPLCLI